MAYAYAILRTEKIKNMGGIGYRYAHNVRAEGTILPNHDQSRRDLNIEVIPCPDPLAAWKKVVGDNGGRKIRSDAVLAIEVLLTYSGSGEPSDFSAWRKANEQFLFDEFGKENVLHLTLHLDERVPHYQALVVPRVDGRLNCKAYLGGRQKCSQMQDRYWEKCGEPFGLERGEKGSGSKHRKHQDYVKDLDRTREHVEQYVRTQFEEFRKSYGKGFGSKPKEQAFERFLGSMLALSVNMGEMKLDEQAAQAKAKKLVLELEELRRHDARRMSESVLTAYLAARLKANRELKEWEAEKAEEKRRKQAQKEKKQKQPEPHKQQSQTYDQAQPGRRPEPKPGPDMG